MNDFEREYFHNTRIIQSYPNDSLKVEWSLKMDQKVCFNMAKKDQLPVIALMERK